VFTCVLVANRGEIAVRVLATLRRLGIASVAVHSDADARARHVLEADTAVRIGPAAARESYLDIAAIVDAARRSGAEAIHPGYGFLSENPDLARACAAAGIVLIGPPVAAITVMGDKIRAKQAVVAAGVPVVPGRFAPGMDDADLTRAAAEVGYPVLVKPAAGGGGKGMRLVHEPAALPAALVSARREARAAFGDETLFVERFVTRPRHIEVQVLADAHGSVIHLGERECSLQRRHQKIVEEAPSALLDPATRERIGAGAVEIARAVGYVGVGTVEFVVPADEPDRFYFLEMNTRLQVEHPVTEMVTGLDLVEEQLRAAAGERLRLRPGDVRLEGHAIEARVYAEDPAAGFLPTGGRVLGLREPAGVGVRVDSGIRAGDEIGTWYDPMLAKVVAWGPDRAVARARLRAALAGTAVLGVRTNLGFLQSLLADPEVAAGRLDTGLVDRELARLVEAAPVPEAVPAVHGLLRLRECGGSGLWGSPSGWRLGAHRPLTLRIEGLDGREPVTVRITGTPDDARVSVADGPFRPIRVVGREHGAEHGSGGDPVGAGEILVALDGVTSRWQYAEEGPDGPFWLHGDGATWVIRPARHRPRGGAAGVGAGEVLSPMPGVVLSVEVAAGDEVRAGQSLLVVEAMKMEHPVTATGPGRVGDVLVEVGQQVASGQAVLIVRSTDDVDPQRP
jgi:acetyl-CoA/propionyl-CoA carboxylase, biotin carboxylase, biotin carboxyl carrier protein